MGEIFYEQELYNEEAERPNPCNDCGYIHPDDFDCTEEEEE